MPSDEIRMELGKEVKEELFLPAREADRHVQPPLPNPTEEKFNRLRQEWISQRAHESSTMKMAMVPAYQKIIGMGPDAVPLLLRELDSRPDMWFWALRAITEADPVTEQLRGDVNAMARAWVEWGIERGYQW